MSHPASCTDPSCTLTYIEHLRTIRISGAALPTRAVNRTPGQPDEPLIQTITREKRWERDNEAYKRLHKQGYRPPQVDGARFRERTAETVYDINERPVTVDRSDPT